MRLLLALVFLVLPAFGQYTPFIQQTKANKSSGSVSSLTVVFSNPNIPGNAIAVGCGVGNATVPTVSDTPGNTYLQVPGTNIVGGASAFNLTWFIAVNIKPSTSNTVTCTNGGAAASIAVSVYEMANIDASSNTGAIDQVSTSNATGTALTTGTIVPWEENELSLAMFGVGTAAQTITVASPYNNDSGQQNPTTPAGLFSFASASFYNTSTFPTVATATITSEPWAASIVSFKSPTTPITVVSSLTSYLTSAASTNATLVKAQAGNITGIKAFNTTTTVYYLRMYNLATAPTCSSATGFVETMPVPPAAASGGVGGFIAMNGQIAQAYTTGIGFCLTGGGSSTDNTNAATGVYVTILYK